MITAITGRMGTGKSLILHIRESNAKQYYSNTNLIINNLNSHTVKYLSQMPIKMLNWTNLYIDQIEEIKLSKGAYYKLLKLLPSLSEFTFTATNIENIDTRIKAYMHQICHLSELIVKDCKVQINYRLEDLTVSGISHSGKIVTATNSNKIQWHILNNNTTQIQSWMNNPRISEWGKDEVYTMKVEH